MSDKNKIDMLKQKLAILASSGVLSDSAVRTIDETIAILGDYQIIDECEDCEDVATVIKALECRKNADKRCGNPCEESGMCHYAKAIRGLDGEIYRPFVCDKEQIYSDAIALFKEYEAVEPRRDAICVMMFRCGACGEYVGFIDSVPGDTNEQDNYCRNCGRKVKWNEID